MNLTMNDVNNSTKSYCGNITEEEFNLALKESLRCTKAHWRSDNGKILVERTRLISGLDNAGKRIDILINDPHSPPTAIECSFNKSDADKDAINRLGVHIKQGYRKIKTSISVYIPESFRERDYSLALTDLNHGKSIYFALHQLIDDQSQTRRWPSRGFIEGGVKELAELVSATSLPKEDIEQVANEVATLVDDAANILNALPTITKEEITNHIFQRSFMKGLKTTMVLWLNALLTQQRLHSQNVTNIPPLDFTQKLQPLHTDFFRIWQKIQNKNWRSIFDPASEILKISGNSDPSSTGRALGKLIQSVQKIEMAGLGLHINVGAELFPKLSEDRKQAAAFYTQAATAELLAALTVRPKDFPEYVWRSENLFENKIIADLACGTGTLLRAGYKRVTEIHEACGGTNESLAKLHQNAMVSGLVGTDVSPIAAHLTSSSLAAIGKGKPYGETRIGWVNVGGPYNTTGSLEFLKKPKLKDLFQIEVAGRSTGSDETTNSFVSIDDHSVDWVLMNPPYSRTRGGQSAFDIAGLSKAERRGCQERWGTLIQDVPAIKNAGMAASFLVLARNKIKPGGRIGFVLPLTAAFADSWTKTRRMIEQEFEEITVIVVASGQALGKDALSADTGMEEMLLVATKRQNPEQQKKNFIVNCVTLKTPITRLGEAGIIAREISYCLERMNSDVQLYPITVGESEVGQLCRFISEGNGSPWEPSGVVNLGLALSAAKIARGNIEYQNELLDFNLGMTTIGEMFEIGPTHDLIGSPKGGDGRGAFKFFPNENSNDTFGWDMSLWSADGEKQHSIVVLPTHKGVPNPGGDVEGMRMKQGKLFYARNLRWTSQALLAASTENFTMGGRAWTVLIHHDPRICKCFALWANSIFGLLIHWTRGQRTQSGRATTQVGAIKSMPCPRLFVLEDTELNYAAAKFDEFSSRKLLPACQAHADNTRKEIDTIVTEILQLPKITSKLMEHLRITWCREPSVHGWNKDALVKLRSISGSTN